MKKHIALLLSLLIAFSLLPTFAAADTGNESEMVQVVEVSWEGTISGPVCDATVTLYKFQSIEPIDAAYQKMWGTFRIVITDADGNVVMDENFDTASKSISLTEPGDYYACVYVRGDLQGLTTEGGGYEPLIQHFCVTEFHEPSVYEELPSFFAVCCDSYPEDHDSAFREYLAMIHGLEEQREEFSLAEGAAYMAETMPAYSQQAYAALYEEFRANEGYSAMEVTSFAGYDPAVLAEEETYGFWRGEGWQYIVNGEDIPFVEDGSIYPYADYIADVSEEGAFEELPEEEQLYEEGGDADGGSSPLPLVAAGVAVVVVGAGAVTALARKRKNSGK